MNRKQAYQLLIEMLRNQNLIKHCLAVEAIMRSLCVELKQRHPESVISHPEQSEGSLTSSEDSSPLIQNDGRTNEFDIEEWGVVGLLHDADYELTGKDLEKHTEVIVSKLREEGVGDRIINGIYGHHELKKPNRENYLEKAVFACDELSGLITAVTLVRPDKKLSSVTVESVLKKFPEKAFAAGANRDQILKCENELGIPLEEFIGISLKAMQGISDTLGL